jgi:hypothetical protein
MIVPVRNRSRIYYLRWYHDGWHYWAFRGADETIITQGELNRTTAKQTLLIGDDQLTKLQLLAICGILKTTYIQLLTDDGWKLCVVGNNTFNFGKSNLGGANVQFIIEIGAKVGQYSPVYEIPVIPEPDIVFSATWSTTSYVCEDL